MKLAYVFLIGGGILLSSCGGSEKAEPQETEESMKAAQSEVDSLMKRAEEVAADTGTSDTVNKPQ